MNLLTGIYIFATTFTLPCTNCEIYFQLDDTHVTLHDKKLQTPSARSLPCLIQKGELLQTTKTMMYKPF